MSFVISSSSTTKLHGTAFTVISTSHELLARGVSSVAIGQKQNLPDDKLTLMGLRAARAILSAPDCSGMIFMDAKTIAVRFSTSSSKEAAEDALERAIGSI